MLGVIYSFLIPFCDIAGTNFYRDIFILSVLALISDVVSGHTIGLGLLILTLELSIIIIYDRLLRLRIRVKIIFGLIFSLLYFYVIRRILL